MRRLILQCLAIVAAAALAAGPVFAGKLDPQTSSQSGVAVRVAPQNLAGAEWEFSIAFDTHSQDLNDDLLKNTVLVVDGGPALAPTAWQGDSPGGHHRKGALRFRVSAQSPASVELRMQRPGETAARAFRWQLH